VAHPASGSEVGMPYGSTIRSRGSQREMYGGPTSAPRIDEVLCRPGTRRDRRNTPIAIGCGGPAIEEDPGETLVRPRVRSRPRIDCGIGEPRRWVAAQGGTVEAMTLACPPSLSMTYNCVAPCLSTVECQADDRPARRLSARSPDQRLASPPTARMPPRFTRFQIPRRPPRLDTIKQ